MNSIYPNYLPLFREYQSIRDQIMAVLTAIDLRFSVEGEALMFCAQSHERYANVWGR
ncbi:hypothetical protein BH10CHL1_BH10CHL1_19320 [soil metagenome]